MDVPVIGRAKLAALEEIPAGKVPSFTVALPLTFTSDGRTEKRKLLEA